MSALAVASNPDSRSDRATAGPAAVRVALVNNMSEGALRQTERLFTRLLQAAGSGLRLEIRHYRPRLGAGAPTETLPVGYASLDDLYERGADVVVVTGAEPLCHRLTDEQSWGEIRRLIEWIAERDRPALLSCLAAHAALLVYDGLERRRLPAKCSGVFSQQVLRHHLLGHGLPQTVLMPHSRYNEVPVDSLVGAGYEPVLRSPEVGWTIAARRQDRSMLLLAQGHPEYSGTTLLREYRRDVGRYLERARSEMPVLPRRCIDGPKAVALRRFHERLANVTRSPSLMDDFPVDVRAIHVRAPWSVPAARLVRNWLGDAANVQSPVQGGNARSRSSRRVH
ncbi:MAG TPA: homoserine O-succinyltransferase [Acidimicrobiales bacterium]|nr:homoserine O-succinyltransferase [Acidimicrobiales bacterium]